MTQETMDRVFHENGLAARVMEEIRRGVTFEDLYGRKFERLVNDLKEDHSLEEIDHYDALYGLFHIYMLMGRPVAKRELMECLTDFELEETQLKLATVFVEDLKNMPVDLLMPSARAYMTLMS